MMPSVSTGSGHLIWTATDYQSYLLLEPHAELTIYHTIVLDENQVYEPTIAFELSSHARLHYYVVIYGRGNVAGKITVSMKGSQSHAKLQGAYVIWGTSSITLQSMQHHLVPEATSELTYNGIAYDTASSLYQGTIRVEKNAHQTQASQHNKNLLFSPAARAKSIPSLEVLAHQVKCAHGTAVGQLDQEALVYMMSRGLSLKEAKRLLLHAFFAHCLTDTDSNVVPKLEDILAQRGEL